MKPNTKDQNINKIKPISILNSIWFFIVSSLIIYLGLYKGIPVLMSKGLSFLSSYLILFYSPFVLLFVTALILYKREGNIWTLSDFKNRMHLKKLNKNDLYWTFGLLLFGLVSYIGLTPVGEWFAKFSFFSPPSFFPAEINPKKSMISGLFMDYELAGQYRVPLVYFIGLVFNILGEEFLWRGIILSRQIEKYHNKAWIYHGIIWTLWHFFWAWNLIVIFPFAMALSYVFYERRNILIPIIAHGLLNSIPLIIILIEVFK